MRTHFEIKVDILRRDGSKRQMVEKMLHSFAVSQKWQDEDENRSQRERYSIRMKAPFELKIFIYPLNLMTLRKAECVGKISSLGYVFKTLVKDSWLSKIGLDQTKSNIHVVYWNLHFFGWGKAKTTRSYRREKMRLNK